MKITIEFNSKRIKNLKHNNSIEKKITKVHENRVKYLLEEIEKERNENSKEVIKLSNQIGADRRGYNREFAKFTKTNKLLLELVTLFEYKEKELRKQLENN